MIYLKDGSGWTAGHQTLERWSQVLHLERESGLAPAYGSAKQEAVFGCVMVINRALVRDKQNSSGRSGMLEYH
jgi:hypothetical protein